MAANPHKLTAGSKDNKKGNRWDHYCQEKWRNWNEQIMRKMIDICQIDNYETLYRQIAEERRKYAEGTGHLSSERFGQFKSTEFDNLAYETFWAANQYASEQQLWPYQAPHVIQYVKDNNKFFALLSDKSMLRAENKNPLLVSCPILVNISAEGTVNFVRVSFFPYREERNSSTWVFSNSLYSSILTSKDEDTFLGSLAKLMYYESRLCRVNRGTESILQIMMGTLAYKKGYCLGDFKEIPIGWNIMALLMPNPNEYAQWFKKNVFSSITKISPASENDEYSQEIENGFEFFKPVLVKNIKGLTKEKPIATQEDEEDEQYNQSSSCLIS